MRSGHDDSYHDFGIFGMHYSTRLFYTSGTFQKMQLLPSFPISTRFPNPASTGLVRVRKHKDCHPKLKIEDFGGLPPQYCKKTPDWRWLHLISCDWSSRYNMNLRNHHQPAPIQKWYSGYSCMDIIPAELHSTCEGRLSSLFPPNDNRCFTTWWVDQPYIGDGHPTFNRESLYLSSHNHEVKNGSLQ